jgi:hypothetical protein
VSSNVHPQPTLPLRTDQRRTDQRRTGQRRTGQRRRGQRVAWFVVGSVFAVATLAWGAVQVVIVWAHETETIDRTITEPVRTIDVRAEGTVRIVGADVDAVRVHAEIDHGLRRTDESAAVEGDRLVLRTDCPVFLSNYCEVDYTIEAPSDVSVVAHSDQGRVTLTDLRGPVDVRTDQGRIEVVRASGDLRLRADQGRIEVVDSSSPIVDAASDQGRVAIELTAPPLSVRARSDQGSVRVVVPDDDETYAVEASTDQGSTDVAVPTDPASTRVIDIASDQGDVSVRHPSP